MPRCRWYRASIQMGAAQRWSAVATALLAFVFSSVHPVRAEAEDVPFNPRRDLMSPSKRQGFATPRPERSLYSFTRYDGTLRVLCTRMKSDGQLLPLVNGAETLLRAETGCASCRALARAVVAACKESEKKERSWRKTPTPVPEPKDAENGEDEETTDKAEAEGQDAAAAAPTEAATVHQRLPSIEVIEAASALGARMRADEPGPEPALLALERLMKQVSSLPDLSRTDREYFGTLTEYLVGAWRGRPESEIHDAED